MRFRCRPIPPKSITTIISAGSAFVMIAGTLELELGYQMQQPPELEQETPHSPLVMEPQLPHSPSPPSPPRPLRNEVEVEDDDDDKDVEVTPPNPTSLPTSEDGTSVTAKTSSNFSATRRPPGKKIKPLSVKQRAQVEEKIHALQSKLEPHDFVPNDVGVDVTQLERALRLVGLWDFANLKFDEVISRDFLVELIAYYDRSSRRSFVKNSRIQLSRPDLSRALGLPVRKQQSSELEEGGDKEILEERGTKSGLVKFLMGWVVLVGDIGIIPDEAQTAIGLIESGQANKVDWAGLLWGMVEREIADAPKTGLCYYASHLQMLMKHQKPGLFVEEETVMEVPDAEEREEEAEDAEEAEDTAEVNKVIAGVDKEKKEDLGDEEAGTKQQMHVCFDFGLSSSENGEEAKQTRTFLDEKNEFGDHLLKRCTSNDVESMEFDVDDDEGDHGVQDRETCEDDFTSKFPNLQNTVDLLHSVDVGNVSFCPSLQQPLDHMSEEFLPSPIEQHKDLPSNYCPPSSSFRNIGKRVSFKMDRDDDDENNLQNFSHEGAAKRPRIDECDDTNFNIDACVDQAMSWMGKAKFIFAHKEQDILNAQMQIQYLTNLVQQKDEFIKSMERNRMEEQHRRQIELDQYEHERTAMSHMLVGYQRALKGSRQAFAEYRKQFSQSVEPLYKDASGPGGVVLTAREFERQRWERLELERRCLEKKMLNYEMIIKMVLEFSREWSIKFESYEEKVLQFGKRLTDFDEEIKVVKHAIAQKKQPHEIMAKLILDKAGIHETGTGEHLPESKMLADELPK